MNILINKNKINKNRTKKRKTLLGPKLNDLSKYFKLA